MYFDDLPPEVKDRIIKALSIRGKFTASRVSKSFFVHVQHPSVWKKTGAISFDDFVTRTKALPPKFQRLILNEQYTLPFAEDIVRILALPQTQRLHELLTPVEAAAMPHPSYLRYLSEENGIIALREKLITPQQAAAMPSAGYLNYLNVDNVIIALREKLITPEQMSAMPEENYFDYLCRDHGIIALREKLITPEEAAAMPLDDLFKVIESRVNHHHEIELRKLITPEQANTIPENYLKYLAKKNGIIALSEKLITPEQAAAMPNADYLQYLFSDNGIGIEALRKKLITPEQMAAMPKAVYLEHLFEPNGMIALREKLITPEQAAAMPNARVLLEEIEKLTEMASTIRNRPF